MSTTDTGPQDYDEPLPAVQGEAHATAADVVTADPDPDGGGDAEQVEDEGTTTEAE